ncbi:MAG: tRNA pseudouridine(38-40) synthase TruA [Candidatus Zixiibacteriota bacterium]
MNILLDISYDGSDFHGWQIQRDLPTVCGVLQNAISCLYGDEPVKLIGVSRTDASVNALSYIANFHAPNDKFTPKKLKKALNATIPESIVVNRIAFVDDDFHARFSALGKIYRYNVVDMDIVFGRRFCHRFFGRLDIEKLNEYAKLFIGEHDFSAFSIIKSIPPNPVCKITQSIWQKRMDGAFVYEIEGNRFLHEMVRMIVGAQLDICRGSLKKEDILRFIQKGERVSEDGALRNNSAQIKVAPPHALFLQKVIY